MDLYLRSVAHPQAHENYRMVLKREDGEIEIGSIGIQQQAGSIACWTCNESQAVIGHWDATLISNPTKRHRVDDQDGLDHYSCSIISP